MRLTVLGSLLLVLHNQFRHLQPDDIEAIEIGTHVGEVAHPLPPSGISLTLWMSSVYF